MHRRAGHAAEGTMTGRPIVLDWDIYALALPYFIGGYGVAMQECYSLAIGEGLLNGYRLVRRGRYLALRVEVEWP